MQTYPEDFETLPPQRPVFLKVLCMLTFIGSGYAIINSAITYFKADDIARLFIEVKVKVNNDIAKKKNSGKPEGAYFINNILSRASVISTPDNLRNASIGNFITAIFCLTGAILMWWLKRIGFYFYVVGTMIGIAIPIYLFGNNFLTSIAAGMATFIGIIFIIFYAMNFKSLQ
ncbi:MAG: hypothetical protein M3004_09995 [Bacteroidota bacterium]|nr:hypothetical protein [Bacteroidota bacterium]